MDKKIGFTIVELLVVIVIIAILATASILAYTGIQRRASNTAVINAARQTMNLIQAYAAAEGRYPSTRGQDDSVPGMTTYSCITTDSGCYRRNGDAFIGANTELNTELATIGDVPKNTPNKTASYGIMYNYQAARTLDGNPAPALLIYYLQGEVGCGNIGTVTRGVYVDTNTVDRDYTAYLSDGDFTSCILSVPAP